MLIVSCLTLLLKLKWLQALDCHSVWCTMKHKKNTRNQIGYSTSHPNFGSYRDLWQVLVVFWKNTFQAGAKCCHNFFLSFAHATWMDCFHGSMYTRYIYQWTHTYIYIFVYIQYIFVYSSIIIYVVNMYSKISQFHWCLAAHYTSSFLFWAISVWPVD